MITSSVWDFEDPSEGQTRLCWSITSISQRETSQHIALEADHVVGILQINSTYCTNITQRGKIIIEDTQWKQMYLNITTCSVVPQDYVFKVIILFVKHLPQQITLGRANTAIKMSFRMLCKIIQVKLQMRRANKGAWDGANVAGYPWKTWDQEGST